MLYNIYGSSKDWDEQILGHLHTIDVDPSQLEAALRGNVMSNPNNCATCDHKRNPQSGWCYAFRDEPNDVCMQHTGREKPIGDILAHFGVKQDDNDSSRVQAAD